MNSNPVIGRPKGKLPGPDTKSVALLKRPLLERLGLQQPPLLPPSVRYDLAPQMPGVFNQENWGSCVLNACTANAMFLDAKRLPGSTIAGKAVMMSRRAAYYQAMVMQNYVIADNGLNVSDGLDVFVQKGYVLDSAWPYDVPPREFFEAVPDDLWLKTFQLKSYAAVTPDVYSMKRALYKHGCLVIGMEWPLEFEVNELPGHMMDPALAKTRAGGHCVLIAGYEDRLQAFRLRNSWGTSWNDGGYAWMPYAAAGAWWWPDTQYVVAA